MDHWNSIRFPFASKIVMRISLVSSSVRNFFSKFSHSEDSVDISRRRRKFVRILTPINDQMGLFLIYFFSFFFGEITKAIMCCNGKGLKSQSL